MYLTEKPNAEAVRTPGGGGNLALHFAIAKQAPAALVKELLQKYADGAGVANEHSYLPLHLAAENDAEYEVVAALVQAYPAAAREDNEDEETPFELWAGSNGGKHLGIAQLLLIADDTEEDEIIDMLLAVCEESFDEFSPQDDVLSAAAAAELASSLHVSVQALELTTGKPIAREEFVEACVHYVMHAPAVEQRRGWCGSDRACKLCITREQGRDLARDAPTHAAKGVSALRDLGEAYLFVQEQRAAMGANALRKQVACCDALVSILRRVCAGHATVTPAAAAEQSSSAMERMLSFRDVAVMLLSRQRGALEATQANIREEVAASVDTLDSRRLPSIQQLPEKIQVLAACRSLLRGQHARETRQALRDALASALANEATHFPAATAGEDAAAPSPFPADGAGTVAVLESRVLAPLEADCKQLRANLEAARASIETFNTQSRLRCPQLLGAIGARAEAEAEAEEEAEAEASAGGEHGAHGVVLSKALSRHDAWHTRFADSAHAADTDAAMAGLKEFAVGAAVGAVLGSDDRGGNGGQEGEEEEALRLQQAFVAAGDAIAAEREQQLSGGLGLFPSTDLLRAGRRVLRAWEERLVAARRVAEVAEELQQHLSVTEACIDTSGTLSKEKDDAVAELQAARRAHDEAQETLEVLTPVIKGGNDVKVRAVAMALGRVDEGNVSLEALKKEVGAAQERLTSATVKLSADLGFHFPEVILFVGLGLPAELGMLWRPNQSLDSFGDKEKVDTPSRHAVWCGGGGGGGGGGGVGRSGDRGRVRRD